MAITYFNSASNPADDANNTTTPIVVTPPASMVAGDLVLFIGQTRAGGGTVSYAISATGGQSWTALAKVDGFDYQSAQLFWCLFNGTWTVDPSISVTGGISAWSAVMHVFRPTTGANTWAVDQAQVGSTYAVPSTPFTVTITGQTTAQANTVTLAGWFSQDDNTWGSLSGTGWVQTGSAQYRNSSGADQSSTYAHKIQTSAAATANVSKNQATIGGDSGMSLIVTFYEISAGVFLPRPNKPILQAVNRASTY